jgi:hypothetical protein
MIPAAHAFKILSKSGIEANRHIPRYKPAIIKKANCRLINVKNIHGSNEMLLYKSQFVPTNAIIMMKISHELAMNRFLDI